MSNYELLLACYLSGQVSEREWTEHLKDRVFAAFVERQGIHSPLPAHNGASMTHTISPEAQ